MSLAVWAVDPGRVRRGHLALVGEVSVVVRDADVGSFQVPVALDDDLTARVGPGWRVIVQDGEETVLSGPITSIEPDLVQREVVLGGVDDLVHLRDRIVYPDPTRPAEQQTVDAYYKRSGMSGNVAHVLIRDSLASNAASNALPSRRVPNSAVGSGAGLGVATSTNLRYQELLASVRSLARLGGFTFSCLQERDNRIVVRFRAPVDRSRSVRFTERNGGVEEGRYALAAPTATDAIVAGQGQGAARTILHRTRATDWGRRIEVFKDQRDTDDQAELEQSATEQLDEGQAGASAQFTVVESPGLRYGADYQLGDTVAVEVGSLTITEPVRTVELTWDGHGRTATLTLGDHDQADDKTPAWVSKWKNLDARVRSQEVR